MSRYIIRPEECSRHSLSPDVQLATAAGEQLMLSLVTFDPGGRVEMHQHPHEQMGLLLEGQLTFTIGDEQQLVEPGQMWRIPGNTPHGCVAGPQGAKALDVFHPVRDDYR